MTDTRIAMIAIVVEDRECTSALNEVLHEYGQYVIGRMGIPYREKAISLISVAVDAPMDVISAMTGKLGNVPGLTVKTAYSKV
jgi:putative iron-only hydrogenase system regulator